MKSYGLVLDQSLQPNKPIQNIQPLSPTTQVFPKTVPLAQNNAQSYSTVVEQAIITKDKPLLKEIIADSDHKTLANTIGAISIDKVSSLLSLLQQFLYEDSRHIDQYCNWLKQLLRQHIGVILSNPENKNVVSRLAKFVQRKAGQRQTILRIKSGLCVGQIQEKGRQFKPKFNYKQKQERDNGQEEAEVGMDLQQQFDDEDMLDEFDE